MTSSLVVALGLVLVIEGIMYGIAPGRMKRMIATMLLQTDDQLRLAGIFAIASGVLLVWLARM
jgi:uncharacterized protein